MPTGTIPTVMQGVNNNQSARETRKEWIPISHHVNYQHYNSKNNFIFPSPVVIPHSSLLYSVDHQLVLSCTHTYMLDDSFPLCIRLDTIMMVHIKHGHIPPSHCGINYIQMFVLMFIYNPFIRECQHLWN